MCKQNLLVRIREQHKFRQLIGGDPDQHCSSLISSLDKNVAWKPIRGWMDRDAFPDL
jgi:hypothetical protein